MGPPPDTTSEPSIEEILDSIRQIIADDDEEPDAAPVAAPKQAAPPPQKPVTPKPMDDDIIELRDRVDEPVARPAAPPPPPPVREPEKTIHVDLRETDPVDDLNDSIESIISRHAETATAKAFAELSQRVNIEKSGNLTVEDVVRYEVRPMLRAWIDKYMPALVERLLQKELEKISRRFEQD